MAGTPFLSRRARLRSIGSTNDVVRAWLADGTPEVCLAMADEQTAGRGRSGRAWVAPPGAALLQSLGFRPTWLPPEGIWRLAASVSLAMAAAAEEVTGLPQGSIQLKWPNDLVILGPTASRSSALDLGERESVDRGGWQIRKLAGVLGESRGLGSDDPQVVVGIGINTGWRAADFPPDLAETMTSLHEASRGRSIDAGLLLEGFLDRLEPRIAALRAGRLELGDWSERQATTGRTIEIERPDGARELVRGIGVDEATGGLVISNGRESTVHVGEVRHVHLGIPGAVGV